MNEKKYWMHRISHEVNVSYSLLKKGYLTIGFAEFLDEYNIIEEIKTRELPYLDELCLDRWGKKLRSRYGLLRFINFQVNDIVLLPRGKKFGFFQIVETAQSIKELPIDNFLGSDGKMVTKQNDLLYHNEKTVDLGFFIKVIPITEFKLRTSYANSVLHYRMRYPQVNIEITDLTSSVVESLNAMNQ